MLKCENLPRTNSTKYETQNILVKFQQNEHTPGQTGKVLLFHCIEINLASNCSYLFHLYLNALTCSIQGQKIIFESETGMLPPCQKDLYVRDRMFALAPIHAFVIYQIP